MGRRASTKRTLFAELNPQWLNSVIAELSPNRSVLARTEIPGCGGKRETIYT